MVKYILLIFLIYAIPVFGENTDEIQRQLNRYSLAAEIHFNAGNIDSSIVYFTGAIQLASQIPDSLKLTELFRKQANAYELTGNFKEAQSNYLRAINCAMHMSQSSELSSCYLGLSNVHYRFFNTESALSNGIKAATMFRVLADTLKYIQASELIAQVYISLGKYDDALNIADEMVELSTTMNDSLQWAKSLNMLGAVYSFKKNYETASEIFQRAASLNRQLGSKINEAINLGNLGEMHLRKGEYNKALDLLNEALAVELKADFNSGLIFLYYTLGETYSVLKMNAKAIENFNKSFNLIYETGEIREKPTVYKLLAEHYERNGRFENAYTNFKNYNALNDSLNKIASSFKVEEMKIKYDISQKDNELQLLMQVKNQQEKELNSKKNLIRLQLVLLFLVLTGLFSSFFFTLYFFRSRKKLKLTIKTKDMLFSIIGHDLRGPMGNIYQVVDAIQSPELPEREKYIKMLSQPTKAVFTLLDDLLAWSRTLDNKATRNPRLIPVGETVDKTCDLLKSEADKKSIKLVSHLPSTVLVYADYNHFTTILRNLVSNAIKFTPENGVITISNECDKQFVKIIVSDTGIGIEPHNIAKILDSNTFFSTFGTNNERGSGLGLVLCQKFIKINGGTFGIESTLGKGSSFYFTLPFSSL